MKEKKLVASFTTGAPEFMYSYEGAQKYPIEDFLPPIKEKSAAYPDRVIDLLDTH